MLADKRQLMDKAGIARTLNRIASEILERHGGIGRLCLVGIRTRGVYLAERLRKIIERKEGVEVPLGIVDITLYRDDVFVGLPDPQVGPTVLDFPIRDRVVILVDDVLYTGRTVRAALDALMDFGRPKKVELAVLVDRGCRELPIEANYVGITVESTQAESVKVRLDEHDDAEDVMLREKKES